MKRSGGPTLLKEAGIAVVWAAAAVNVFSYTWKAAMSTYKRPPLSVWKGIEAPESAAEKGKKKQEKKGKSLPEELLEKLPENLLKGFLP